MIIILTFLLFPDQHLERTRASAANSLWVDQKTGKDSNNGRNAGQALRTIQAAANLARPGTIVHILPGVYRESIVPASDGTAGAPVVFIAEAGPGTVRLRGSAPASSLAWIPLASNSIGLPAGIDPSRIYYVDLSTWGLEQPPRFILAMGKNDEVVSRLMPAREPDWRIDEEWKLNEFWWMAEGGSAPAGCDPITNEDHECDLPQRSFTQLTDRSSDSDPVGMEPGNLTTLGDLRGATLVAMDAQHALYVYRRTIIDHDVATGRITVNEDCDNDGGPGLGWGSKYYVENHPGLLDQPGEWWFDEKTSRLYLWVPGEDDPAQLNLEISLLDTGFDLTGRSYITIDGLVVEFFNRRAYTIHNENPNDKAFGNIIRNSTLRYANSGVVLYQYMNDRTPPAHAINGFLLENSEVAYMDTVGVESTFWWDGAPSPDRFRYPGVSNAVFKDNSLHHLGYNSDSRSAVGVRIFFPDKIKFTGNHVHHVANAGVHFHLSLINSKKKYGFSPQEILLGDILIADNIIEKTCLLASDCGGLKISGSNRPDTHVFRDVLVTGNVFRHIFGWSYVSLLRQNNQFGDGNGFYLDYASGVHVYRNIAYNNSGAGFKLSCLWRDGDAVFLNNIAADNYLYGLKLTGTTGCDDHSGSVNTQIINNLLIRNGRYGFQIISAYANRYGNLTIDHNLYYQNGWDTQNSVPGANVQLYRRSFPFIYLVNLRDIRAQTPWENHGVEGDPLLQRYDLSSRLKYQYAWPDFRPTKQSFRILNGGSGKIPGSLLELLVSFGVEDLQCDIAREIGRYEFKGPSSYCKEVITRTYLPLVGWNALIPER